ncbi:MAG: hypothetical protein J5509_02875 [Lachnospiraceae bacterium]|nr:hypothetical protein [Lachnospiraceae bacterium]
MYQERFKELLKYSGIGYGIGLVLSVILVMVIGYNGIGEFIGGVIVITIIVGSLISIVICSRSGVKGFMNGAITKIWSGIKHLFFGSLLGGGLGGLLLIIGILKFFIGILIMIPIGLFMAVSYLLNLLYLGIMSGFEKRNKLEGKESLCKTLDKAVPVLSAIIVVILCMLIYHAFSGDNNNGHRTENAAGSDKVVEQAGDTPEINDIAHTETISSPPATEETTSTEETTPIETVDTYTITRADITEAIIDEINTVGANEAEEFVIKGSLLNRDLINVMEHVDILWTLEFTGEGEPELVKLYLGNKNGGEGNRIYALYSVPYKITISDNYESKTVNVGDIAGQGDAYALISFTDNMLHSNGGIEVGSPKRIEVNMSVEEQDAIVAEDDGYTFEEYVIDGTDIRSNDEDSSDITHSEEIVGYVSSKGWIGGNWLSTDDDVTIHIKNTDLLDMTNKDDNSDIEVEAEPSCSVWYVGENMDLYYYLCPDTRIEDCFLLSIDGPSYTEYSRENMTNKDGDSITAYIYDRDDHTTMYIYEKPILNTNLYLWIDIEEEGKPDENTKIDKYIDMTCNDYYEIVYED